MVDRQSITVAAEDEDDDEDEDEDDEDELSLGMQPSLSNICFQFAPAGTTNEK